MKKNLLKILVLSLTAIFVSSCLANYSKKEANDFIDSNTDKAQENKKIIADFYTAFKNGDAEKMASFYHEDIEFEDPAFSKLKGKRAGDMWRMLTALSAGNLKINFSNIKANDNYGSAEWVADYNFSQTGRKVHNEIKAFFEFKDGKIYRHNDYFDLWKWGSQAFGVMGSLLGGTPFFKAKLNEEANKNLDKYISEKAKKNSL
ncbi:MAG: nuclear transport factor 2 family protein [Candidatus Sericytochromatia bacterium]